MTALLLHVLAGLFCAFALTCSVYALLLAVQENHTRGVARVHRGTSWADRVPTQREHR